MKRIHRSLLILPVNVPKFIEKAHQRKADAIMLDLEDSVPDCEKAKARTLVNTGIESVGRAGADVFVRINNDPEVIEEDVDSAVYPGLHALFIPKVESFREVDFVEHLIEKLEIERNIERGSIKISIHIESPRGMMNLQEIANASDRIESMSIGSDDYCLQLGVEPSSEGWELFLPFSMMVNVCRANGLEPMGILGSVSGYTDWEGFRASALRGRSLGASGAFCIHPDQVKILNEVFSPTSQEAEQAKVIIKVFEEAWNSGRASTSLDGKMIDTPIYKRAKQTLEKWEYFCEKA